MAYAYWKNGLADRRAVFQHFFRKKPFGSSYAICAGLQPAIEFIENFRFEKDDLDYLATLKDRAEQPLFEEAFLRYLGDLKMEVNVDAMEEGTPVFPNQPILRVEGPIIQAQILESALLNIINFQTLIATKSSRVCLAAEGDHVVEFGLRRAQGVNGAIAATRAAFVGGCHSTSNTMGGKLFGIPVMGTMAHSFIMTFDEEKESFRAFARAYPHNAIFLIDTYDSIKGVENAIEVAKEMQIDLIAVRLDSGDLFKLSKEVRKKLDAAGMEKVQIMATNELTEQIIGDLKRRGAPISVWGVGTNLVTAKDQPALDGVYKLSAVTDEGGKWKYRLKISDELLKTTNPGISQVRRYFDEPGYVKDVLYDVSLPPDGKGSYVDLLVPMFKEGRSVYSFPSLDAMRTKTYEELKKLPKGDYPCEVDRKLLDLKKKMMDEVERR